MFNRYQLAYRAFSSAAATAPRVGFIGLGSMGLPMATNCKNGGHQVKAFDILPEHKQRASEAGLTVVDSIAEACKDVDYVALSLPATKHVEEVLKQEGGVFESSANGTMICDTSTISPIASAEFAKDAEKEGLIFMDTPMSGGTTGAMNATLCFMIGGQDKDVDRAKVLLKPMGANFIHCGPPGMGETAKLTNNLILGINMVAASEGFAIGEKLGMDPKTLAQVISVSSARSFVFDVFHPRPDILPNAPSSRNYENGFQASLIKKDMVLALEAAHSANAKTDMLEKSLDYYVQLEKKGKGTKDFGYVYQYISKNYDI